MKTSTSTEAKSPEQGTRQVYVCSRTPPNTPKIHIPPGAVSSPLLPKTMIEGLQIQPEE